MAPSATNWRYSGIRITPCESCPIRLLVISDSVVTRASDGPAPAAKNNAIPSRETDSARNNWLIGHSPNGDRVPGRARRTFESQRAEHKTKLAYAIRGELLQIQVFEVVNTVLGQVPLMHRKREVCTFV